MSTRRTSTSNRRAPLTQERVLRAAVALADEQGADALTMRNLGKRLGVEAMSLYNYVASKDDLLGRMVDTVFGEIRVPAEAGDWKAALRSHATRGPSASWSPARTPGRRASGSTTPCSGACAAPASRWR